jgi:hypothetical protein
MYDSKEHAWKGTAMTKGPRNTWLAMIILSWYLNMGLYWEEKEENVHLSTPTMHVRRVTNTLTQTSMRNWGQYWLVDDSKKYAWKGTAMTKGPRNAWLAMILLSWYLNMGLYEEEKRGKRASVNPDDAG